MTTTSNPSNLFIDIMDLNGKCQNKAVSNATSAFIYHTYVLENELTQALEHGTVRIENMAQISKLLTAIEDMHQSIPTSE